MSKNQLVPLLLTRDVMIGCLYGLMAQPFCNIQHRMPIISKKCVLGIGSSEMFECKMHLILLFWLQIISSAEIMEIIFKLPILHLVGFKPKTLHICLSCFEDTL